MPIIRLLVLGLPLIFPLYLVRFNLANIPTNVVEVSILLLFFAYCFVGFLKGEWTYSLKNIKALKKLLYFLPLLMAIAMAVIIVPREILLSDGNTWFEGRRVALGILKGWIIIPFLYFYLLSRFLKTTQDSRMAIHAYILSCLPLVLWGIYQLATGQYITPDARVSGPFVNANYLALYITPAFLASIILLIYQLAFFKNLKLILSYSVLGLLIIITVLTTHSYAAILGLIGATVVFAFLFYRLNAQFQFKQWRGFFKKLFRIVGIAFIVLTIGAVFLFINTEKWKKFTNFTERSSSAVRLQVYEVSAGLLKESWLWGIGFGQFEAQYNVKAPDILGHAPYEWVMIHPHNTFLAMWLNLGLIGLVYFLCLIFYCFKVFKQTLSFELKLTKLLGISLLVLILVHGLVDTHFFKNDLALIFWLIVGVIIFPRQVKVEGLVVEGLKLGHAIGFPTINLKVLQPSKEWEKLAFGIYACRVLVGNKIYKGAMHYGSRPAIQDEAISFEVHLLDFQGDLKGQKVKVAVCQLIRGVANFPSLEDLKVQIAKDVQFVEKSLV